MQMTTGDAPPKADPELWQAILDRIKQLQAENPDEHQTYRSTAMLGTGNKSVYAINKMKRKDGTDSVYLVQAGRKVGSGAIYTHVERWQDHHEEYWENQIADRRNAVVVNHVHHRIGRGNGGGFGGRTFYLRNLESGEVVRTNDLWYQGVIPPIFREQLPNTHEFASKEAYDAQTSGS